MIKNNELNAVMMSHNRPNALMNVYWSSLLKAFAPLIITVPLYHKTKV
jgi:hypothetical protein